MLRKLFTLAVLVALVAGFAVQANAAQVFFVYRYRPAPVVVYRTPAVVYAPAPIQVAYDPDDRYAHAYQLQGVVTSSVPYHMFVRVHDDVYPVSLHDGTIIKPTGITLTPSMIVNVAGYWSGNSFIANRIVVLRY